MGREGEGGQGRGREEGGEGGGRGGREEGGEGRRQGRGGEEGGEGRREGMVGDVHTICKYICTMLTSLSGANRRQEQTLTHPCILLGLQVIRAVI